MQVISFIVLALLVVKIIDFLKQLQNREWNAAATQLIVWIAGFLVLVIGAQSHLAQNLVIPPANIALGKLAGWDLLLMGLVLGSNGSVGWQAFANLGGGSHEVSLPLIPSLKRAQAQKAAAPTQQAA